MSVAEVVRVARGRYALPIADQAVVLARRACGVLGLTSAALHHGWEVTSAPDRPWVVVPKDRRLTPDLKGAITVRWADLGPDDVDGIATSPYRTRLPAPAANPFESCLRPIALGVPGLHVTPAGTTRSWSTAGWCCASAGRT